MSSRTLTALSWMASSIIILRVVRVIYVRRQFHRAMTEHKMEHTRHLRKAHQLQDSLLESLQILVLRFHCAAEQIRSDDPGVAILQTELKRAKAIIENARASLEGLATCRPPGRCDCITD